MGIDGDCTVMIGPYGDRGKQGVWDEELESIEYQFFFVLSI